jgi:hypothetical protein
MKIKYLIIILILLFFSALNLFSQSNYCYTIDLSRQKWHSPDTVSTGVLEQFQQYNLFSIDVFPNPFENHIKLNIVSKILLNYEINIINILSIEVFRRNYLNVSNDHSISIDIESDLSKGVYLLIISGYSSNNNIREVLSYKLMKY